MRKGYVIFLIVIISMSSLVGCATTSVDTSRKLQTHKMPERIRVPEDYQVSDRNCPIQLIYQGMSEAQRGRSSAAASFYGMAANISEVPKGENSILQSALFARAYESLKSGNQKEFRSTMEQLDDIIDVFDRARFTEIESTMFALYNLSTGIPYNPNRHPAPLKPLFFKRDK